MEILKEKNRKFYFRNLIKINTPPYFKKNRFLDI